LIAVVLLYVGAVLLLNGLWILGQIQDREISVINIFAGGLGFIIAIFSILQGRTDSILFGALVLLFAFTYLWVAANRFLLADGRGLGWFCLFVAITAVPTALINFTNANGATWPLWLGADWAAWAVLWFMYWLLLARKAPIARATGLVTVGEAIGTAWIPGYLLLFGYLPLA
jgi:putative amide transporter protein